MTTVTPQSAVPAPLLVRKAGQHGLTRDRLRGNSWERLSRGLYGPREPGRSTTDLARMTTPVLPRDSGWAHLTSARLRGWWTPNQLGPHVLLASTTSRVHVQRRGVYVRRSVFAEVEVVDGIPVSTPAQTLIELARDLVLVDLVPMVDCALAAGADPDAIMAAARPRLRGAATLRRAVQLADPKSESWWESVLRLVHVLTGLGPVECQVELFSQGSFIARTDLHLIGTHRYPECDGGEHRQRDRHDADLGREKWMSRSDYERYGYSTREIARQPEMIIRDAEDARGWRHDPERARTWWRWTKSSTLTGYGRTCLAARLARYARAAIRA
ncbi:MAG TPA: hypothetical protein VFJ14_04240 [Nocardioidaceae bacterium]|nr:hypothetical protein [Nocardioidaceae bacterium]